jgi:hypothetical protein
MQVGLERPKLQCLNAVLERNLFSTQLETIMVYEWESGPFFSPHNWKGLRRKTNLSHILGMIDRI